MTLIDFFLRQHATVHAAAISPGMNPSVERWLGGLSDAQLRLRPGKGLNSIVWLLWHTARVEDVAVNLIVLACRQVLDEAWTTRMNYTRRDIGTGMTADEVAEFSETVDTNAVLAYRAAVGTRTREVIPTLAPLDWERVVGAEDLTPCSPGRRIP
jgi:hypothetical protein